MATVKIICPKCAALLTVNKQNDSQRVKCPKCNHDDAILNFPEPQRKQVQCPRCRSILSVYAMAEGALKCPKCQYEASAASYPAPNAPKQAEQPSTEMPTSPGASGLLLKPGILALIKSEDECSPSVIRLKRGVNTIGRNAATPKASITLHTKDAFMSRLHATIDLIMKSDGTFAHSLSDAGSQNGTWHNGEKLEAGDQIILKPEDTIQLGHTTFEFKTE
jgi:DNA-directed RNA polymerase subunit M/transcription elongation factor TFIIS